MTDLAAPPASRSPLAGLTAVPRSAWPLLVFVLLFAVGALLRPSLLSMGALWSTVAFAMILAIASFGQTLAVRPDPAASGFTMLRTNIRGCAELVRGADALFGR